MEINENDVLVLPEGTLIPIGFPHKYHIMKYLHKPSIVFSQRGYMNTTTSGVAASTGTFILGLLGITTKVRHDTFLRHVRIKNPKTREYYHNKGATLLIDLIGDEGRFLFSYAICNHEDNFNKLIAQNICRGRMERGDFIEVINYDPSISIIQNIFIAIGVFLGEYPLTDYDWTGILPELCGTFTHCQEVNLSNLRRLIRSKYKTQKNINITKE
jgi:hypothetical protein